MPETNLYKIIEVKLDNKLKNFQLSDVSENQFVIAKFLTGFFKSLLMNSLEWIWDSDKVKWNFVNDTYKRNLG